MKRNCTVFLAFLIISGSLYLFSCKGKEATTGSLTVTALIKDSIGSSNISTPAANKPIYLATSRENLDNRIYAYSGYTDIGGSCIFRELPAKYFWYRIEGWDDYGAAEVFLGYDGAVILWLNSPSKPKNK
jgi:hypothetical protein